MSLRVAQNLSDVAAVSQASSPSPFATVFSAMISLSAVLYLYRKGLDSIAEIWIGLTYLVFGFVTLDMFFPTVAAIPASFVLVAASFSDNCSMSNIARAVPFAGAAAAIGVLNSLISAGAIMVSYAFFDLYLSDRVMNSAGEISRGMELPSFRNERLSLGAADVIIPSVFAVSALQFGFGVAAVTGLLPLFSLAVVLLNMDEFRVLVPVLSAASFIGFAIGMLVF